MNGYIDVLKKYAVFDGRAGREEFWYFISLNIFICVALFLTFDGLWTLFALIVLIPTISVSVRRLHDIDRSGWWFLIVIVPVVDIALLLLLMQDGEPGTNQYGFNPKDVIA